MKMLRRATVAALGSLILVAVAAASHAPTALTLQSFQQRTVTIGWQPAEGATGYRLSVDGTNVSTAGPNARQARFGTPETRNYTLGIEAIKPGGARSTITVQPRWSVVSVNVPDEPPPTGEQIILRNRTWSCRGPVNLALVKVTIDANLDRRFDGIHLDAGCTGRIDRIEVITPFDGMKIHTGARNLTIGGGWIHCLPVEGAVHQDGVQAMGGGPVTLRNLDIDCGTNSAMFLNMGAGGQSLPTDIVCDGCTMRKLNRNNRTLRIGESLRSGARNSTIYWCGPSCPAQAVWVTDAARSPVNEGNRIIQYGG